MLDQYDDMMSVQDLQEALHVGKNRAYELLRNGTVQAIRMGKSWKVPKEAVIEFLRCWQKNNGSGAR